MAAPLCCNSFCTTKNSAAAFATRWSVIHIFLKQDALLIDHIAIAAVNFGL